jgi:hypothetical protein
MSRLMFGAAGLLAVAIWLPWPLGGNEDAAMRDIRFAGPGDPSVSFSNLASRPLLDPTRGARGRAASQIAPRDAAMDFDQRYVLRGLATHDAVAIAVIEDRSAKTFVRLQRGQVIGDWFLVDVSSDEARLQNASGEMRSLKMPNASAMAGKRAAATAQDGASPKAR